MSAREDTRPRGGMGFGPGRRGPGGPMGPGGMLSAPVEKPKSFKRSFGGLHASVRGGQGSCLRRAPITQAREVGWRSTTHHAPKRAPSVARPAGLIERWLAGWPGSGRAEPARW